MKHYSPALFQCDASAALAGAAWLPRASVMDLPMVDATTGATVEALLEGAARRVFFVNAHTANLRARIPALAAAFARADAVLPDGIGVELAGRMTGTRLTENLNGTDFVPELLRGAAKRGLSVFLFGGTPGTADAAAATLCTMIPGLRIAGTRDGYEGAQDDAAALAEINASGADILLVAMGVPKQEIWIDKHSAALTPRLQLGVGALFDFLAGNVARAPMALRRARLEWVWRLAMEPRRMAGRYLLGNATFLARAARHALAGVDRAQVIKRGLDLAVSLSALLLLAPLLLLVAAAIKADSRGPVFFKQTRVGKDGVTFGVYKFRSMFTDAEARRAALLATSDREGVCFKARHDPRVTRVGRLLRRLSVDELPQILNVLKGEMSIVGPRPALREEVAAYPARALGRLRVKPGITGLWQVSGRADIGFDKMIDMDLAYVRAKSPLLDLLLIAMTFRAVVSGRGAY